MTSVSKAAQHDAYAAEYESQVEAYYCHITDALFGLTYEFTSPGQVLLDIGIGSGLSSQLFARAGLEIHGMDFSSEFLKLCREKRFCTSLTQHDVTRIPWPYPAHRFDHVVCCGVMHFIPDLEGIFAESARVLREGGLFTFTTRVEPPGAAVTGAYRQISIGDFEIYNHSPTYLDLLEKSYQFGKRKVQKCFVGDDVFSIQVVERKGKDHS